MPFLAEDEKGGSSLWAGVNSGSTVDPWQRFNYHRLQLPKKR
jgi:hypothetical protein